MGGSQPSLKTRVRSLEGWEQRRDRTQVLKDPSGAVLGTDLGARVEAGRREGPLLSLGAGTGTRGWS